MMFASLNVSRIPAFGADVQCREVIDFSEVARFV